MKKIMGTCMHPSLGLFLIRVALALVFIWHGYAKLSNMEATVGFFGMMGFATFWAWAVALTELIGGILMLLGLWTWIAGIALAIVMAVAVFSVKWSKGFLGGFEYELSLMLVALGLAFVGPGKWAIGGGCGCCKDGKCATCK